ncbi:hypothetical protein HPP92_014963 [Vanilla planifolia]|uniref:Uncharacterized protein n=1 Tax=Vanilla planifolia TaxID=51239 RepID=A0A835QGZ7_VANPL|nr:hypothetical protein HPP92_014963 [Vanilla planifolia]
MGSGASRHLRSCFRPVAGGGCVGFDEENVVFEPGSLDETLGHSFRYVRSSSPVHSRSSSASFAAEIAFKSISCASVSANSSSTFPIYDNSAADRPQSAGFQSSSSFSAIPLHLAGSRDGGFFLSGPIERGALSGPIEPTDTSLPFSGPLVKKKRRRTRSTLSGRFPSASFLRRSLSEKNRPWVVPLRSVPGRRCGRPSQTTQRWPVAGACSGHTAKPVRTEYMWSCQRSSGGSSSGSTTVLTVRRPRSF